MIDVLSAHGETTDAATAAGVASGIARLTSMRGSGPLPVGGLVATGADVIDGTVSCDVGGSAVGSTVATGDAVGGVGVESVTTEAASGVVSSGSIALTLITVGNALVASVVVGISLST